MPKANDFNTTNRRAFLRTMAVPAVAGAVMALTPPSADPIFAAMDAHRDRMEVTDRANERLAAAGPDGDYRPMQAALWAEHADARALIETAPTTRAGLRALDSYLLPVGHARNELRQLAIGLLWLEKRNLKATVQDPVTAILALTDLRSGAHVHGGQNADIE
jgi:hypothetical protein